MLSALTATDRGEDVATVLSLTKEEKARLLKTLREDAAFREDVRRLLLDEMQTALQNLQESIQNLVALRERDAVLVREGFEAVRRVIHELSQQVQENSRQIAALTECMDRVEAQIAALTERMDRVEAQIAALTERMDRVEAQIAKLTGEVQKQGERLDDVSGVAAEAGAYREITLWLRSRRAEIAGEYLPGDLQDRLGVSPVLDGVMLLRGDSGYVFLVYEITFTIALRDVRRIAEWLGGFRKVAWPAVGLVHFQRALPEEEVKHYVVEDGREVIRTIPGMRTLREEAAQSGVLLMQHGASPWRPEGWRPPQGLAEIPQLPATTLFD
jgi:archaellum component FlaC